MPLLVFHYMLEVLSTPSFHTLLIDFHDKRKWMKVPETTKYYQLLYDWSKKIIYCPRKLPFECHTEHSKHNIEMFAGRRNPKHRKIYFKTSRDMGTRAFSPVAFSNL